MKREPDGSEGARQFVREQHNVHERIVLGAASAPLIFAAKTTLRRTACRTRTHVASTRVHAAVARGEGARESREERSGFKGSKQSSRRSGSREVDKKAAE